MAIMAHISLLGCGGVRGVHMLVARGADGTACKTTMWSRTFSILVQVLCTLLSCLSRNLHVYHHLQLAQVTEGYSTVQCLLCSVECESFRVACVTW